MLVLEFPPSITQIHDLQFKEYLLKKKNYDIFFKKYFPFFLRATKGFRAYFPNDVYNDILYNSVMTKIPIWNGKSSLGTFLYASIKYDFLSEIKEEKQTYEKQSFIPLEEFDSIIDNRSHNVYEGINNLELDSEEKNLLDYYSRYYINQFGIKKQKNSLQSYKSFCSANQIISKILNKHEFEMYKNKLAYKIITQLLPDRKDLLLKFDLVKLRK